MSFVVSFFCSGIFSTWNLKCSFDPIFQDYHLETRYKVETPSALKKKNKEALWQSQALTIGRSLGLSLVWTSCGNKQKALRGYHLYKYVWKLAIRKKLHAEQEPDNSVDKFAMKVLKTNEAVAHVPPEYLLIFWYFIASASDWLEMFSCSSKAKINCLKELLKSKIRW